MKDRQQPMMDWDEFEKYMLKQFPFIPKQILHGNAESNKDWVGDYVQTAMKRFFNHSMGGHPIFNPFAGNGIDYNMFETHRSVFVQLRLPDDSSPDDVRFSASRRKLKISYSGTTEEIILPSDVDSARSTAKFKDGLLEVRMPKIDDMEPFYDITVRD